MNFIFKSQYYWFYSLINLYLHKKYTSLLYFLFKISAIITCISPTNNSKRCAVVFCLNLI